VAHSALVLNPSPPGSLSELHDPACAQTGQVQVITQDNPDGTFSFEASAPSDGFVVMSEPYFPERRAWLDGSEVPVQRTDLAFSGVFVPAGSHHVELRYIPTSFEWGLAVSVVTLLAWLGLGAWTRRRQHRKITLPWRSD
jgi:uncharacterized membrane protein YfhO